MNKRIRYPVPALMLLAGTARGETLASIGETDIQWLFEYFHVGLCGFATNGTMKTVANKFQMSGFQAG